MSAAPNNAPWPTEIRLASDRKTLQVTFDDGACFAIKAEALRVESPSAEVQGHSHAQKKIVTGKENVRITDVQPVGHYAVRLVFDDGHDTGLYTWPTLYKFGLETVLA